jgi:hypothetical protein
MRQSELDTKDPEENPKRFSRLEIGHKSNRMYACVEQDGYSAAFIYRPPIYDGPLALNASVGYKFAEVPRITNDLWVLNLRATLA